MTIVSLPISSQRRTSGKMVRSRGTATVPILCHWRTDSIATRKLKTFGKKSSQSRIIALEAQLKLAMMTNVHKNHLPRKGGRDNKGDKTPRKFREEDAWKLIPPTLAEGKTKRQNKKSNHWCSWHKMWTIHSPKECTLAISEAEEEKAATAKATAMTTIVDDDSDDDDSFAAGSSSSDSNVSRS
mmetsp:Transcript_8113/g.11820  ORF Transcript_8113/g.11820 Transcript_8113/m.11820 type:complete len:184 (+) Transcript_8113:2263-2814(+)